MTADLSVPPCDADTDMPDRLAHDLERMLTAINPGLTHDEKIVLMRRFADEARRRQNMHSLPGGGA